MVDIAQLVRVSGCGPEGRRFEPGYPPHIFRSVPRPFTCRAADIAEGRRIFYVPAFAFTLPFCLLRVFAFFLLCRLFLFLYARLSGFFPVCALYCIPSVLPALSGRSLPSLSGLRFYPRIFRFLRSFLFRSFVVLLERIFRLRIFFFSLLVISSASPAPPARRFAVFPPWERTMPNRFYRGVAQLVERVVWDHQAAGSNPVTRTISPP